MGKSNFLSSTTLTLFFDTGKTYTADTDPEYVAYKNFFENNINWKIYVSDKGSEKVLTPVVSRGTTGIQVDFAGITKIEKIKVKDSETYWLRAETKEPLSIGEAALSITSIQVESEAHDILPELAFFNAIPLDTLKDFYLFGERPKFNDTFFFAVPEAFTKEGSSITVNANFQPGLATNGIVLQWEFWNGKKWETFGVTTTQGVTTMQGQYKFLDSTKAFTGNAITLNDRASQSKPTLRVAALTDTVTMDVADVGNKFKLTIYQSAVQREQFDELTMETVVGQVNGISNYIIVENLGSPSTPPANRPAGGIGINIPCQNQRIEFTCPKIEKSEANGKENYWIRVRIVNGNYGEDAKMELVTGATPPYTLDKWIYSGPSFQPPSISSLNISYTYEGFPQDVTFCWTYNNFLFKKVGQNETFQPFISPVENQPALHLGFDKPFSNNAASLYLAVKENIISEPPTVVWEYWNGSTWKNLGVQDETKNLTEPGMVEFIGPTDFVNKEMFEVDCYWIRVRLEKGEKSQISLLGIYTNTTWARQCITINNEIIGSSTETPNATFNLSRFPVLEGQKIEIREPEKPGEEELHKLLQEEGADAITPVTEGAVTSREYWVRWHEVQHFRFSDAKSRHYVIDRPKGRIIFGDGIHGMIPPAGRDNIRAVFYQAGGGVKGNVSKNTITALKRAIPFVDKVMNVDDADGGSEGETMV